MNIDAFALAFAAAVAEKNGKKETAAALDHEIDKAIRREIAENRAFANRLHNK